jgi:hypothetical protein
LLAVPGFLLPLVLAIVLGLWIALKELKTNERKSMKKGNNNKNREIKLSDGITSVVKTAWAVVTSFCGSCLLA